MIDILLENDVQGNLYLPINIYIPDCVNFLPKIDPYFRFMYEGVDTIESTGCAMSHVVELLISFPESDLSDGTELWELMELLAQ